MNSIANFLRKAADDGDLELLNLNNSVQKKESGAPTEFIVDKNDVIDARVIERKPSDEIPKETRRPEKKDTVFSEKVLRLEFVIKHYGNAWDPENANRMRTAAIITSALLLAGFIGYKLLLGGIAYNIGEADTLAKITSKESTAEAKTVAAAVPVFGADKPGRSALKPSTPPDASAILAAATPFHKEKAIAPATIAEPQPGPAPVERNDNANRKVGPVPKLPAAQPKAPETRKQAERVVTPPLPSTTTRTANSSKEVVKPLAVAKSQPQGESPKQVNPSSTLGMPTPAANEKPSTGSTPTAADQRTKEEAPNGVNVDMGSEIVLTEKPRPGFVVSKPQEQPKSQPQPDRNGPSAGFTVVNVLDGMVLVQQGRRVKPIAVGDQMPDGQVLRSVDPTKGRYQTESIYMP